MRILCALFLALGLCASAAAELRLGINAEEPAPTIARLLSERLTASMEIGTRVFPDSQSLLAAIAAGEIDLAFVDDPVQAIEGAGIVSTVYPSVLHILVANAQSAQSLDDILGAPGIWAGTPGGVGHRLATQLATDYGIASTQLLPDPWSQDPAVFFVFGGLLAPDALARLGDYQLYSLDRPGAAGSGSVAEGIALRHPNFRTFILPAELYPTLSRAPALTLAVNTLLIARSDLDDELVYDLAMAMERLQPEIAALYPLAGLRELGLAGSSARTMPLHPGAQRYADREQPGLVERYAEFVGAIVTAAIGLITLSVALYRRRRQARKDRLDNYYQQALQWRDALASGSQPAEQIAQALRELQREVFDLLVAERIDADAALLAFMNLSNQLLREAEVASQ